MCEDAVVELGDRSCPVRVRDGWEGLPEEVRALAPRGRAILVTDERVGPLHADPLVAILGAAGVAVARVVLPSGEAHKTLATWARCVDGLLGAGVDRGTPVLALGGGVLGDVAGFAAATALRGVPWVHLPTTVLAMADASIGGKTGVNHASGKNLVGAFHQPRLVHAALHTLATLDAAERVAGLGEVLKTALLVGDEALAALERDAAACREGDRAALRPHIETCVRFKAAIVGEDEREAGRRRVLNLGHTVAHALETAAGPSLRHGEAVALGLLAEARWAVAEGLPVERDLPGRVAEACASLGLPLRAPRVDRGAFLAAMALDKKRIGDSFVVPIAARPGRVVLADLPVSRAGSLYEALP